MSKSIELLESEWADFEMNRLLEQEAEMRWFERSKEWQANNNFLMSEGKEEVDAPK